jgi:hypothetical protein
MNVVPVRDPDPGRIAARAVGGLLLVLFGLTWLAGSLGLTDLHQALREVWPWPAILVLGGCSLLLRRDRALVPGLLLVLAGGWVWAHQEGLVEVPFGAVLGPVALVLLGGYVILRAMVGHAMGESRPAVPQDPRQ